MMKNCIGEIETYIILITETTKIEIIVELIQKITLQLSWQVKLGLKLNSKLRNLIEIKLKIIYIIKILLVRYHIICRWLIFFQFVNILWSRSSISNKYHVFVPRLLHNHQHDFQCILSFSKHGRKQIVHNISRVKIVDMVTNYLLTYLFT